MSRLAMDQITITDVTDGEKGVSVKIVTPFYALGTAAPSKPTVNPPGSIWTTTEPEYIKGKNLYTTQRTVLEDSTFSYSDVSLNSSYKASEQAITTADTANTTAGEAKTTAGEAKTTATSAKDYANLALANAQELVVNGGFETGDLTGWTAYNATGLGVNKVANETHSGEYMLSGNLPTIPNAISFLSKTFPVVQGRILRCSGWFWNDAGATAENISISFSDGSLSAKTDIASLGDGWKYASIDVTVPPGVSSGRFRLAYYHPDDSVVFTRSDDLSVKDITEAKTAQDLADKAASIATEAKTASTTNKDNLASEIQARNEAIANLKTSVDADIKVVQQKAADAQQAGDTAADDLSKFRTATESQLTSINGLVGGVRTDVDAVTTKANTLASCLDSANTKITSTSDDLTGLTNTVSNISKTADDSMALSTTNHQDLAGFKTTVQQTYSTKQDTLNQVTTVDQKADALSATLSKDYQKTADSDAKYSTKAELTAASNSITASVAEMYATKSVVDALKNIADKAIETWQGPGEPTLTNLPASDWTTADLKKQHSGDVYYDTDSGFAYRFGSADGTTYKWGRISDSDITKALNLASKAQETADGAVAGVTKLNTDIPLTYASKSEVKVTTDAIKADVVEAKRIGQTGVNNAAALAIRANGIDATLSQQATNIDNNVKAIAQVNLRADSLNTSITQVSNKTDIALANAQELIVNGGFENGFDGWYVNKSYTELGSTSGKAHSGSQYAILKAIGSWISITQNSFPVIKGHTYRISAWIWTEFTGPLTIGFWRIGGASDGDVWRYITESNNGGYKLYSYDYLVDDTADRLYAKIQFPSSASAGQCYIDDVSVQDVTGVKAAQQSADAASSKAKAAISQSSQLSQDLSGFKTSVGQTYETKTDSTSKATTAQQNLQGFKNTVQNDYLSKTDAGTTYSTKTETTQTAESLTNKITNVGKDATSALTRITTTEQDVKGFKNTVSATYATKSALSDTNGNVSNAQMTADQAIFSALPSLADPTKANTWLCAIFPAADGSSIKTLPSYSLIAPLAASYTKYNADSGDILRDNKVNYSYGLIRTLVSFNAATTWTFTYSHDDGSRIYVDGVNVFERAKYTQNDPVTISFAKGNHIVDVMYSNGVGGDGVWAFSVALSSIATTMYAPAGASALATALDKAQKDVTTALSQYTTLSQDVNGFKQTVDQKYETKEDSQSKNSTLSQSLTDFKTSVSSTYTKQTDFNALSGRASQTFGFSGTLGKSQWGKIGTVTMKTGAQSAVIEIHTGSGWNGGSSQNSRVQIMIKRGNSSADYKHTYGVSVYRENCQNLTVKAMAKSNDVCEIWAYFPWGYWTGNYAISGLYDSWDNASMSQDAEPTSGAPQEVAYRLNPEQLQSDVAETYASKTSVEQTATQITSQVETKYATKDDVSNKYTTLQQTDQSLTLKIGDAQSAADTAGSNAANAQGRVGNLETCIQMTADGVRVGKIVNGAFTGYSALMNSNGSFDIRDSSNNVLSKIDSNSMSFTPTSGNSKMQLYGDANGGGIRLLANESELTSVKFINNLTDSKYLYSGLYNGDYGQFLEFATLLKGAQADPLQYDARFIAAGGLGKLLIDADKSVNVSGEWYSRLIDNLPTAPKIVGMKGVTAHVGGSKEYKFNGSGTWVSKSDLIGSVPFKWNSNWGGVPNNAEYVESVVTVTLPDICDSYVVLAEMGVRFDGTGEYGMYMEFANSSGAVVANYTSSTPRKNGGTINSEGSKTFNLVPDTYTIRLTTMMWGKGMIVNTDSSGNSKLFRDPIFGTDAFARYAKATIIQILN